MYTLHVPIAYELESVNIIIIITIIVYYHTLVQVATVLEQVAPQVRLDAGPTTAQVPHQAPHLRAGASQ